jgi:hypothetical protein
MNIISDFFINLKTEKRIAKSSVGSVVRNSKLFKLMEQANAIEFEKMGRGSNLIIVNQYVFEEIFKSQINSDVINVTSKIDAAKKFGNSKIIGGLETNPYYFYRGNNIVKVNNETIDLGFYTNKFGFFGCSNVSLETDRLCWIENKDCFEVAEKTIGKDYVFVHKYGRLGQNDFSNWRVKEVLFCPDYDFTGLEEYLYCKENFPNTTLFIPSDFQEILKQSRMPIKGEMKDRLKNTNDEVVLKIRDYILRNNKFLEQQILFN